MTSAARISSPLDAQPRSAKTNALSGLVGTLAAHAAVVALAVHGGTPIVRPAPAPPVTEMFEIELPPPTPAEAPPPERKPPPPTAAAKAAPSPTAPAPRAPGAHTLPPSAASAGMVLSASDEAVDFGAAFVSGSGSSFAGGATTSAGAPPQSRIAAEAPSVAGSGLGDRSRPPSLTSGVRWDCPFPSEASERGIDHAVVALQVAVAADGGVTSAAVANDPGCGFAREARRCALRKRWMPGLDRAGRPIAARVLVNVRFDR